MNIFDFFLTDFFSYESIESIEEKSQNFFEGIILDELVRSIRHEIIERD